MTISSATSRNDYTGNNSTATYSYTFKIFASSDLVVIKKDLASVETTLVLTTDYTVSGVGNSSGGSITLVAGNLATGFTLTIKRVRPLTQLTDIRNQGDFYPEVHEDEFDKLIMIDQQQQEAIDRSLKLPGSVSPSNFSVSLPATIVGLANRVLVTNASGNGFDLGVDFSTIVNDGYVSVNLGTKAAPAIRGRLTNSNSGLYFKDIDQPCLSADGVDVFRVRSDGQIDCGVGAEDDDHSTGTSQSDFNYRGLTLRCVTSSVSTVIVASKNQMNSATSAACLEAKTIAGDAFVFLSRNDVANFSFGIVAADNDSWQFTENFGFSGATIRAKMDGITKAWRFGTDTTTTPNHKFIGASLAIESVAATAGPAFQIRSLRTAVGAGESIGDLQWYSSDITAGGTGVQADIRAIETGGTGVNYYMTFRTGTGAVLAEAMRLLDTGRALFNLGSTANPGIAALSDVDTGIQFGGANDMYLVTGGAVKLQLLAASVRFGQQLQSTISGSFGTPDYSHNSDPDSGLVLGQANDVYLSAGGANKLAVNATGIGFNAATPIARPDYTITNPTTLRALDVSGGTLTDVKQVVGTLVADLISYGLLQ